MKKGPNGLTAPDDFWDLTKEQLADISNGCGPSGWGLLVPDRWRLIGYNLKPCCDIHDFMYHAGYPKKEADRVFHENCLVMSERVYPGCQMIAGHIANGYFLAVKNGGAGAYNRAKE